MVCMYNLYVAATLLVDFTCDMRKRIACTVNHLEDFTGDCLATTTKGFVTDVSVYLLVDLEANLIGDVPVYLVGELDERK